MGSDNDKEITKEKILEYHPLPITIEKTEIILNQMKKSICQIDNQKGKGTGFLCSIPLDKGKLKVLITNNHLIDKTIIEKNNEIILKFNENKKDNENKNDNDKIITINEKRKMYTNKEYDVTIIEILPKKDNIEENVYNFLELDELVFKRKPNANKESVYILQYPKCSENKAAVSYGVIDKINSEEFDINHYCSTDFGSSGSPILFLSSNKVIGIHKEAGKKKFQFNKGTFLKFAIQEFLENKNMIKVKKDKNKLTKKEIYDIKYKEFIKEFREKKFSKILFMIGGGINFSKESILFNNKIDYYEQLNERNIFELSHFLKKPKDFYEFYKSLNIDKLEPNIYYKFMNYFVQKNMVKYIFTQNVDGLEIKAKIPQEKVIFVHGNTLIGHCPKCNKTVDIDKINEGIKKEEVYFCPTCAGPCKPNIVFFGESLPTQFFEKIKECKDIDLIIVIGSYLTVSPFSNIPELTNKNAYKLLFNDEIVGDFEYDNLEEKSLLIQGENKKNIMKFLNDTNLLLDFLEFLKREYNEELN